MSTIMTDEQFYEELIKSGLSPKAAWESVEIRRAKRIERISEDMSFQDNANDATAKIDYNIMMGNLEDPTEDENE